jgi:exopolysaccharide biosynthesis WecB/TagA/CpsF family protein
MYEGPTTVRVLGVPVARVGRAEAISAVERAADAPEHALIAYVNAHTLNLAWSDRTYGEILGRAALVLNDGAGLAIAGRIYGAPFPENLNGSDFNPEIVGLAARRSWRVYFLGAGYGVAHEAARRLQERHPDLRIAGIRDGFFPRSDDRDIAQVIKTARADVVLVAMGNPLQEVWLDRYLAATGARLGVGVGAFFDFTAGNVRRAPQWMNRWGVEWLWRLVQEPKRLWRRYILGSPLFLVRVLRDRYLSRS